MARPTMEDLVEKVDYVLGKGCNETDVLVAMAIAMGKIGDHVLQRPHDHTKPGAILETLTTMEMERVLEMMDSVRKRLNEKTIAIQARMGGEGC